MRAALLELHGPTDAECIECVEGHFLGDTGSSRVCATRAAKHCNGYDATGESC